MHFKVQKNTFPSTCNELPGEPRREGGRRKETNMAGRQFSGVLGGNGYSGVGGLSGGQHGSTSSVSNFCGGTSGGGGLSASQQLIRLQHQVRIAQHAVKFINYCFLSFQGEQALWRTRPSLWSSIDTSSAATNLSSSRTCFFHSNLWNTSTVPAEKSPGLLHFPTSHPFSFSEPSVRRLVGSSEGVEQSQ